MDSGVGRSRICPECRVRYHGDAVFCPHDGQLLMELSPTFCGEPAAAGAESPPPDEEGQSISPGVMIGDYRIESVLASGGMGVVYAGVHPLIRKRVAIKVINRRFAADKKAVARFVLEARSVNEIGHHNIVDIFAIGELDDGRNYLVMELIDGVGLHEGLHAVGRFRPGQLLPVYEQLCDALETAHTKGFIHRDIKPENVLVLRRPPYPFIKILDFGLAKLRGGSAESSLGVEQTVVGTVVGTPAYMAPEQCRGGAVDARTDVYAMGVMLFELLTGQRPFVGGTQQKIMLAQLTVEPPAPSTMAPELPASLDAVALRALSKDPELRQPSARAFFAELQEAVGASVAWPHHALPPAPEIPRPPVPLLRPEPISDVIQTDDDEGETRRVQSARPAAGQVFAEQSLEATLPPPISLELVIAPSAPASERPAIEPGDPSDERPAIAATLPLPTVDGPDSDAMLHQLEAMLDAEGRTLPADAAGQEDLANRRTLPMPLLDVPDSAVQGGPADPPASLPAAPRSRRTSAGAPPLGDGGGPASQSTGQVPPARTRRTSKGAPPVQVALAQGSPADQSTGPLPGRPPVAQVAEASAPVAPRAIEASSDVPDTTRERAVDWPGEAQTWKSMSEETYVPALRALRGGGAIRRGDSWLTSPWVWVAALIAGILVGAAAYLIVR